MFRNINISSQKFIIRRPKFVSLASLLSIVCLPFNIGKTCAGLIAPLIAKCIFCPFDRSKYAAAVSRVFSAQKATPPSDFSTASRLTSENCGSAGLNSAQLWLQVIFKFEYVHMWVNMVKCLIFLRKQHPYFYCGNRTFMYINTSLNPKKTGVFYPNRSSI